MPILNSESRQFLLFQISLFLILSTLFSLSHEEPIKPFPDEGTIRFRRSVLGVDNNSRVVVLAAKTTHREDPLQHFKYYNGGWNISDKHYFFSVGFTAAPQLLIAALWFSGFGIYLLLISLRHRCSLHSNYGYSRTVRPNSLASLSSLTIVAIIGCIVLYIGQGKFYGSAMDTLDYIVEQSDETVDSLRNVSDSLEAAKQVRLNQIMLPPNVQANIERVDKKINDSANTLESEARRKSHKIHVLESVRLVLIVIATVMLVSALLCSAFSVLGKRICLYIMVIFSWILVAVVYVLCAIFVIVHNVTDDTCVAIDQWVRYPTAHTALDNIIPCVDSATAREALNESKDVTSQLVGIVNAFVDNVANLNVPPNVSPNYYNQTGPLVSVLCNPYNSIKTDPKCKDNEVNFSNAAQEWKKRVCQVSASGICSTEGRLTPLFFDQMKAAVNVSYVLHHYAPFLVDISDCSFVRRILSSIVRDRCPVLRRWSELISIGLVMVSTAVMGSVILWLLYARKRRVHGYIEHRMAAQSRIIQN